MSQFQFLFDEQITSRLSKDIQYFDQSKDSLDQKYPLERAQKFNKGIKRLGTMPDGGTYLDHFRLLVTQIGNAMGYVRMIRSGGLHFVSNSMRFAPKQNKGSGFEAMASQMSEATVEAAKILDQTLDNLVKNFSDGNDYFQVHSIMSKWDI